MMNKIELKKRCKDIFEKTNHTKLHFIEEDEKSVDYALEIDTPPKSEYPDDTMLLLFSIHLNESYLHSMFLNIGLINEKDQNKLYRLLDTINLAIHGGSFLITTNNKTKEIYLSYQHVIYLGKNYKNFDLDLMNHFIVDFLVSIQFGLSYIKKHGIDIQYGDKE